MIKRLVRQIVHRERTARSGICGLDRLMCAVNREAERPHALVGIVEADAVFGFDVVPIPLRFADQFARGSELLIVLTRAMSTSLLSSWHLRHASSTYFNGLEI